MFLNKLNKKEKEAFLQLAHYTARIEDDFSEEEKKMIQNYCREMEIEDKGFKEDEFELDKILETFESEVSKRIVLLELMAMIYADNKIDEKEEELIQKICRKFIVTRKRAKIYEEWTKTILSLYTQGELLLTL